MPVIITKQEWEREFRRIEQANIRAHGSSAAWVVLMGRAPGIIIAKVDNKLIVPPDWRERLNEMLLVPDHFSKPVTRQEVEADAFIITEFLEFLRWLAEMDESHELTTGQVWRIYQLGIREGRVWSEVSETLGLPVREEWV